MSRDYSKNAEVHRDLKFDQNDHQQGDDVKVLQRAYNDRVKAHPEWNLTRLVVDGDAGRQTIAKCLEAGRALGLTMSDPGVNQTAQRIIRNPDERTPDQLARSKKYKPKPAPTAGSITGTDRQKLVGATMKSCHLYYSGQSHRFYSQNGALDLDHEIAGPPPGKRSDCSSWKTGMHKAAELPNPNGTQGYGTGECWTESLKHAGKEISRNELQPGDHVIYCYPSGMSHHIEEWIGNGDGKTSYAELAKHGDPLRDRTAGHGSPPVDFGDIDMIAGPRFFRPRGL